MIDHIIRTLGSRRFSLTDEKKTQEEIEAALIETGIPVSREVRLGDGDIIDFVCADTIGIECKLKGGRRAIYEQVRRYAQHDSISTLILVTNVPTGFPEEINGKPVYVVNLAKAWL